MPPLSGQASACRIWDAAAAISRTGQGAGAWCRTCCYWFCGTNGAGREGRDSIGESGFWAIIERKIESGFFGVYQGLFASKPAPTGECIPKVGAGLLAKRPVQTPQSFWQATKSPPSGGLPVFTG
ncbi:hypothetical protein C3E98_017775 [Pseudomonas sp. MWU13-2625]|nr:hypothetical protein C3E98_017775 [Pseudomonas sp. MWU13-2625]